jgi:hypothetical protein
MVGQAGSSVVLVVAVVGAVCTVGCAPPGGSVANRPVAPMCTILVDRFLQNVKDDEALEANRTDSSAPEGFTAFHSIAFPRGNPAIGSTSDIYGISEAWSRNSAGDLVVRAQAHPARRSAFNDFNGSAWSIQVQGATGAWSPVIAIGSANNGSEVDDPASGGLTVPQLMPVGSASPQVFACAGLRSQDDAVRSTWLIEVTAPNPVDGTRGGVSPIQDLLNGDDRFVPNAPGPIRGPANPPTPTLKGVPGNPVRDGTVKCAMTQLADDVTTRGLHMLAISNGTLYHSLASDFGQVSDGTSRFRVVSPWGDVGQVLGGGFGTIVAAAITASRPTAISVFFLAQSGGRYRLFHAVRFSDGSWRPADDVFALNGATLNGMSIPSQVAAGMCPVVGQPQSSELVYAIWEENEVVLVGRVLATPQPTSPGVSSIYPSMSMIFSGFKIQRPDVFQNLVISARPFFDAAP